MGRSRKGGAVKGGWWRRFACAGRGLGQVLWEEPSGRVHAVAVPLVGALGMWAELGRAEWAMLALAAGGVIAAEALNTAVERLADRISLEQEEALRVVKDMAAGGVLAASVAAAAAGAALLGPACWAKLAGAG